MQVGFGTSCNGSNYSGTKGNNGTGGLLIIFANQVNNNSNIESKGSNGGGTQMGMYSAGGGASGGGSINIFYKNSIKEGTITAAGGAFGDSTIVGGNGGDGSITKTKIDI